MVGTLECGLLCILSPGAAFLIQVCCQPPRARSRPGTQRNFEPCVPGTSTLGQPGGRAAGTADAAAWCVPLTATAAALAAAALAVGDAAAFAAAAVSVAQPTAAFALAAAAAAQPTAAVSVATGSAGSVAGCLRWLSPLRRSVALKSTPEMSALYLGLGSGLGLGSAPHANLSASASSTVCWRAGARSCSCETTCERSSPAASGSPRHPLRSRSLAASLPRRHASGD